LLQHVGPAAGSAGCGGCCAALSPSPSPRPPPGARVAAPLAGRPRHATGPGPARRGRGGGGPRGRGGRAPGRVVAGGARPRYELDAAILFSDIMTPLQGMGIQLSFEPGPVVSEPIRTDAQIEALPELVAARDVPFVLETIRLVRAAAPRGTPLIGFAGAPFTLLCYLVCGRPSKEFAAARTFLYAQPESAQRLL